MPLSRYENPNIHTAKDASTQSQVFELNLLDFFISEILLVLIHSCSRVHETRCSLPDGISALILRGHIYNSLSITLNLRDSE